MNETHDIIKYTVPLPRVEIGSAGWAAKMLLRDLVLAGYGDREAALLWGVSEESKLRTDSIPLVSSIVKGHANGVNANGIHRNTRTGIVANASEATRISGKILGITAKSWEKPATQAVEERFLTGVFVSSVLLQEAMDTWDGKRFEQSVSFVLPVTDILLTMIRDSRTADLGAPSAISREQLHAAAFVMTCAWKVAVWRDSLIADGLAGQYENAAAKAKSLFVPWHILLQRREIDIRGVGVLYDSNSADVLERFVRLHKDVVFQK